MSLPSRWQPLHEFLTVLLDPLLSLEDPGLFVVEANGPDGEVWTDLRPHFIDLSGADPALAATRMVALLCGARSGQVDPPPEAQGRRAMFYAPSNLTRPHRGDDAVLGLSAIVIDIDDRNHDGRGGSSGRARTGACLRRSSSTRAAACRRATSCARPSCSIEMTQRSWIAPSGRTCARPWPATRDRSRLDRLAEPPLPLSWCLPPEGPEAAGAGYRGGHTRIGGSTWPTSTT